MTNKEIADGVKRKMLERMAEAVKTIAAKGSWREPPVEIEATDAAQIAKEAVKAAYGVLMGGMIPQWFSRAINATVAILREDELLGLDCVAALLASVERAEDDQKCAALSMLWDFRNHLDSADCAIWGAVSEWRSMS